MSIYLLVTPAATPGVTASSPLCGTIDETLRDADFMLGNGAASVWIVDGEGNLILPADQVRLRLAPLDSAAGEPRYHSRRRRRNVLDSRSRTLRPRRTAPGEFLLPLPSTPRIARSEGTSAGPGNSIEWVRLHRSGTLPTAVARRNLRSARLDVQLKRKSHLSSPRTSVLVRTSFSSVSSASA